VLVNCKYHQIADNMVSDDPALFVNERELHKRLAPHLGRDSFRAAIRNLEADSFPRINKLFRGRYFPAVVAWLDNKYGVGINGSFTNGPEQFDAFPQRQSGA
jgi:hypothetical protein